MSVVQRFTFGSKIVQILQKCCCSEEVLQEITFNRLVRANLGGGGVNVCGDGVLRFYNAKRLSKFSKCSADSVEISKQWVF